MYRLALALTLLPACVSEPASPIEARPNDSLPDEDSVATTSLAAQVCPLGPFARPIEGTLTATEIAATKPQDLDPNDSASHLYEGPVWLNSGLYFSDFLGGAGFPSRILRYVPGQDLQIALDDSGTNGLALNALGQQLYGARHKSNSVVQFSADLSHAEDLAAIFEGEPFNSPNDVVTRSDQSFYFTDPDFQTGAQNDQPTTNVYWVNPEGMVAAVDTSIDNPNGISLSPDEKFLFVSGGAQPGYIKRYPVAEDGSVGVGTIVVSDLMVPDGMVFDCAGNLYATEHANRRIRVFTMDGEELGRIEGFGRNVTNVAFGGPERKTLYVTTAGELASIEMPVPGLPY